MKSGYCVLVVLLVALAVGGVFASLSSPAQYVITAKLPNITLVNDDVFLCMAVNMTTSSTQSDFIVDINPKPVPGTHGYHMLVSLCDEPGYVPEDGHLVPWECGVQDNTQPNPPLPRGHVCSFATSVSHQTVVYQYQDGPPNESRLVFPTGTGYPIGGRDDDKFLVFSFHFPSRNVSSRMNGRFPEIDVGVKSQSDGMHAVRSLTLSATGRIAPHSRGMVNTSWTLDEEQEIRFLTIYSHWHDLAIRAEARIDRRDGGVDVILDQDTRKFSGVTNLPDSPSVHMHQGDRLVITCTYDNHLIHAVEVETHTEGEMCVFFALYTTISDMEFVGTKTFSSWI